MKKTFTLTVFLSLLIVGSVFAAGTAPMPTICDRTCWVARAPICSMSQEPTFNRAVIHHTAAAADWLITNITESKARVRAHQNYHIDTMAWCDIGYQFLTDKLGNNFEGRLGSLTSRTRGAHDGINTCSFGISLMGYLHTPENNDPPLIMRNAMYDVIAWKADNPFNGFGAGTYASKSVGFLCGHLDVTSTACPGDLMYIPYIGTNVNGGEARNSVNARITGGEPTPTPTPAAKCFVNDITMSKLKVGTKNQAKATVWIKNDSGANVSGATVTGNWTGIVTGTSSGATGADGKVILSSPTTKKSGTITFCVTNVVASGYTYDPALNVMTCNSIAVP